MFAGTMAGSRPWQLAQSPDEWMELFRENRTGARTMLKTHQPTLAWNLTGFAMECCLKAAIMRHKGLNRWTDPALYVHDLTGLAGQLGIRARKFDPRDKSAAHWKMV